MQAARERVERLARQAAMSAGVDLAWTEIKGPRGGQRVRVFIEGAADGVGLADCERVNEKLSLLLDVEDPIPGSYTLEVSTPGLDRPLHSLDECRRFVGQRVRVKHRTGLSESRRETRETVIGTLEAVESDALLLDGPGGACQIRWEAVVAARLDPDLDALLRSESGSPPNQQKSGKGRGRT